MAKSFKSRKKARNNSKAPPRIDSTAGVVLPSEGVETAAESLPPPSAEAAPSEPVPSEPTASEPAEEGALAATTKAEAPKKSESKIAASKADPNADFSGEFFAKPVEEIHLEEMRREAPDLHEEAVVVPRRRVDRRAHQVVIGVLAFAGAIGIAGAVMRKATPRASAATAVAAHQPAPAPAPVPAPVVQMAVPAATPAPTETVAAPAPTPTETAAPAPAPAPTETVAAAATTAAPAATTAAPAATTAALAAATAAPAADDEDSLTGAQLLSKARQAINSGAASKAASYAKKAISKGAGGSAYYVLGAAYQTMGSNGAAKGAYGNCAKSGCAEAGECASLAESL